MLGERVRSERVARKLTQEQLAAMVGTSPPYIGHIECGRRNPKYSLVARIAAALGVAPGELLAPAPEAVGRVA